MLSNFCDMLDMLMNYKFQAQINLTVCLSIKDMIEMNNDQKGFMLSEMSIFARTLQNITKKDKYTMDPS